MPTVKLNPSVDARDAKRLSRQCTLLLERLQHGTLTNVEAAIELRILNLTARVSELRQSGHNVVATRGTAGVWTYRLIPPPDDSQLDMFGHVAKPQWVIPEDEPERVAIVVKVMGCDS